MTVTEAQRSQADINVIQLSALQTARRSAIVKLLKFKYLIVDEAHQWVRGAKGQTKSNQLSLYRTVLIQKAEAVFLLSGTPFKGDMNFDLPETIKSLAPDARRLKWTVSVNDDDVQSSLAAYGDSELDKLRNGWKTFTSQHKSRMLIPIMIRRTSRTEIDGVRISENWLSKLLYLGAGRIAKNDLMSEMEKRERLVSEWVVGPMKDKVYEARCVSYSSRYITHDWRNGHRDPSWWDSFSLTDAREFKRGQVLVGLLQDWKKRGMKPMIFAYSRFHQQFAARVCRSHSLKCF